MLRFSANLSMLYPELTCLDRFDAAARDGFTGVEYLGPYSETPEAITERLQKNNLTQALFNLPSGDWAGGERGIGALPAVRQTSVVASLKPSATPQCSAARRSTALPAFRKVQRPRPPRRPWSPT